MKQKYLFIFYILIGCIIFSCIKKEDKGNQEDKWNLPAPTITNFTPANPKPGEIITISGENFSDDPEGITVSVITTDQFGFNGKAYPAKVINTSLTFITCVIPDTLSIGNDYTIHITIKNRRLSNSNSIPIPISEPTKGWFYNEKIKEYSPNPKEIRLSSNDVCYILDQKQMVYTTKNGGKTWKPNASFGYNRALAVFDNYAWLELSAMLYTTKDGGDTWVYTGIDTIKTIPHWQDLPLITGLYMSSPTKGQLMKAGGWLYYINGSFAPQDIIAEYQSIYATNAYASCYWRKMSNMDEFNLIIYGFVEYKDGQRKIIIAHKKDGIFNEYEANITIPYNEELKALQLVTKDIAFLIDSNNNLFKLTGGTNWIKLNQKATALYFTDINTGYIGYNGKILKTTDGGNSWQDEFTLHTGDEVISITGKNGKLWAIGAGAKGAFLVKYNP